MGQSSLYNGKQMSHLVASVEVSRLSHRPLDRYAIWICPADFTWNIRISRECYNSVEVI